MDGIHIVAFAEEEDPGLFLCLTSSSSLIPFFKHRTFSELIVPVPSLQMVMSSWRS